MPAVGWKKGLGAALALALLCAPAAAQEQQEEDEEKPAEERLQVYDAIEVSGRDSDMLEIADSASEGVTGSADLASSALGISRGFEVCWPRAGRLEAHASVPDRR